MRTLTYLITTTIDGFIATPDGAFDVFARQGDHLAHGFAVYPETCHLRSPHSRRCSSEPHTAFIAP